MTARNRGIRGIRHPLPQGTLIGRKVNGGEGAPGYITFQELAQYIASFSGVLQPPVPPYHQTPQFVSATGTEIMLLSGIPQNIAVVDLSTGTWDVSASVTFDPTHGSFSTFSDAAVGISLTPMVLPAPPNGGGFVEITSALSVTTTTTLTTAVMRLVLTTPGPVWLVAKAVFT